MKNKNWARSFQSSKGAYASNSNEWVSYNDVQFVKEKAEYVLSNKFGGVAVFTMDMDDFNNDCCQVKTFRLHCHSGRSPASTAVAKMIHLLIK